MFNTRRMWLPALLGAFFMSRSRTGRGWMGSTGRMSRNRNWATRGTSRNWLARLLGGNRGSVFRLLR